MEIIDHGDWVPYTADLTTYPVKLPPNVLFVQRVSDGKDWYQFQRKELTNHDSIKMTVLNTGGDWVVQATATDPSYLFPANMKLIEVVGATDFHETFRQKIFDDRKRGGNPFLPAIPFPVERFEFLIALHKAGLLETWQEFIGKRAEVPIRLALEAERTLAFDDRYLVAAARELGWNENKLRQLFETAKES